METERRPIEIYPLIDPVKEVLDAMRRLSVSDFKRLIKEAKKDPLYSILKEATREWK